MQAILFIIRNSLFRNLADSQIWPVKCELKRFLFFHVWKLDLNFCSFYQGEKNACFYSPPKKINCILLKRVALKRGPSMESNMGTKGLPLLPMVQRNSMQTCSGNSKMYFSLYATKPS